MNCQSEIEQKINLVQDLTQSGELPFEPKHDTVKYITQSA